MNYLIANRAYQSDHCPFRMRRDINKLLAFRTYTFFAGVNLFDPNGLAATVTVKLHLGRLVGYESNAFALGTINLPACERIADIDYLTA